MVARPNRRKKNKASRLQQKWWWWWWVKETDATKMTQNILLPYINWGTGPGRVGRARACLVAKKGAAGDFSPVQGRGRPRATYRSQTCFAFATTVLLYDYRYSCCVTASILFFRVQVVRWKQNKTDRRTNNSRSFPRNNSTN